VESVATNFGHEEMRLVLASDGLPARPVREWSDTKHYYVSRYIDIFATGMKNLWGRLVYADLLAGPGISIVEGIRETESPALAAVRRPEFAGLFLNDLDPTAAAALRQRVAELRSSGVRVERLDCNSAAEIARRYLFPKGTERSTLGLAFIDPTAYQMRFESIAALSQDVRFDLVITFMTDFAKRFLRTTAFQPGSDFDRFMGTREWQRLKFETPLSELKAQLLAMYRGQLERIGYQVDDRVTVKNSTGRVLYHLVYASKDPRGIDFWKRIGEIEADRQRRLF
jgi:three-Cys-motif partner protein